MTEYAIFHCDPSGNTIDIFDASLIASLSYTLVENEINAVEIVLPQYWAWDYFKPDQLLLIQRDAGTGPYIESERAFLLTDWEYYTDENNMDWIRLVGLDGLELLNRRIIPFAAGSSYSKKTDEEYDDMILLFVRENLGASAVDTARRLDSYITVASGRGDAPIGTMEVSFKNVYNVCMDCAEASYEAGTYLLFDMEYTGAGRWFFDTWIDHRGVDHGHTSTDPRYVQIWQPRLTREHSEERNYIYCGGKGEGSARIVKTATDVAAAGASIWARREMFVDARSSKEEDAVQAQADKALKANRRKIYISGQLLEGDGFRYGIDYSWGDIVSVNYRGQVFDCHIRAVEISLSGGVETINVSLRSEEEL